MQSVMVRMVFRLGNRQREVVYVSHNMVDVTLMERGLNHVKQPPRQPPALKLADPNFRVEPPKAKTCE